MMNSSQSIRRAFGLVALIGLLAITAGCRRGGKLMPIVEAPPPTVSGKMVVDAYLFDVRAEIDGHMRTLRADVYFTDSLTLLTVRAYLGKGVAEAIWRPDSAFVYFPTENTYFAGPIDGVSGVDCLEQGSGEYVLQRSLSQLFSGDTATLLSLSGFRITEQEDDKMTSQMQLGGCPAPLRITFETEDDGALFIEEFEYLSPKGERVIRGNRRTLKRRGEIDLDRFSILVPIDARRLPNFADTLATEDSN